MLRHLLPGLLAFLLWTPAGYAAWEMLPALDPAEVLSRDLLAERVRGGDGPRRAVHTDCGVNQGLSRGWADSYSRRLDGQWIDVMGLAAEEYVPEVEVNAEHLFVESNYYDNRAAIPVRVTVPGRP